MITNSIPLCNRQFKLLFELPIELPIDRHFAPEYQKKARAISYSGPIAYVEVVERQIPRVHLASRINYIGQTRIGFADRYRDIGNKQGLQWHPNVAYYEDLRDFGESVSVYACACDDAERAKGLERELLATYLYWHHELPPKNERRETKVDDMLLRLLNNPSSASKLL